MSRYFVFFSKPLPIEQVYNFISYTEIKFKKTVHALPRFFVRGACRVSEEHLARLYAHGVVFGRGGFFE